ncbi:MAG TPA: hypothetical protein PKB10_15380, partial [Tepidisphaeraceae bacterium]|nr:hypothetical protein [Tepidisphaeraceae bacterium]
HEGNQFVNCNAILGNAGFLGQIDGDKFTVFSSGIPGIGTWQAGDRAWNTNPAVGQPVGWVYTTSWRSMGNLA